MDRVPDDIFNDLMLDVSGTSKWPTMAASELRGLSGPQLQICKSDFLGKEQRPSDGFLANRGMFHQNEGSTSLALRIDSQRSSIPIKSKEQTSRRQSLTSAIDSKNDVIFLGYANKAQPGNPTESSKQAPLSCPVPWRVVSKQDASSLKLAGSPQLGFPSQNKGQISSPTESSKQVSSSCPPPWRLDSRQDTPSLTHAGHLQTGFPAITKGQTPNIYSTPWSMDASKGASFIKNTSIQQSGFPAVSKGQTSNIYPVPLSSNSSKGPSSVQVTHITRSVVPPGSKGQGPNIFPTSSSLDSSKGAYSVKGTNVQQYGLSTENKGQSSNGCSLSMSMAFAKQLASVKQAAPLQSGSLAKNMGTASSSRTDLKGKDHVQGAASSGLADRRKSGSPAPRIAKAGIAHVMYETIMQEMVGSYEVTEESVAKMTILGIPEPDPTKTSRRKHRSGSRSRSRPRSSGRDARGSHLSSYRRRSRSPYYRSSYRSERDRHRRRSSSSGSSSSEHRRRRDRRNRSQSRDRSSRRNRSRSRNRNRSRSRKNSDNHYKNTKKKEETVPPAKTPTIALIGKNPVDPDVVKVIRSLLAYSFKSWRVKDYEGEKPEFWYLFDESSVEYQYYRLKLSELQKLKKSIKDATAQACQTSSEEAAALAEELAQLKERIVKGQIPLGKETATVGMQTGQEHPVQERPANVVPPSQSLVVQGQAVPCVEQYTHRQIPAAEAETPKDLSEEAAQSKNYSAEKTKSTVSGTQEESTSSDLQFSELDASTRETAENLARFLVEVAPEIDGGFDLGIISENPEFWFLKEKESPVYKFYYMKLTAFCQSSGVSYDSIYSSSWQKATTQNPEPPQPSKHQDPVPSSLKPPVDKPHKTEIIEILDSDFDDSGSQKSDHHDSEPLVAESQDSEPEEPEPKVSKPQLSKPKCIKTQETVPKQPEPQGCQPQEPKNQPSELRNSRPDGSKPQQPQPNESELFVTCCSEDDQSDSEDLSPPNSHHKVELQPVASLDEELKSTCPKKLQEQPQEKYHNSDPLTSPLLVVEPQSTRPEERKYQPEVLQPQSPLCHDGLEPMTDVVAFQPLEETETEPAESTASEEAAEIPSPTQSSPRRKRGRPVSSVPSKQSCVEEEATGLEEPMTDVVAFQSLEETETEPAESTASEEAAEIPSPTQSSSRQKRGLPLAVSSVPSKQSCADDEATGLEEPMTDVVAFQSLEETETEPAESTASEEAAEIPSPTQSSSRQKRGLPLAVSSVPSKQSCADDEATGLEPMTDVVAFQPLEETEIEPAESTASEEAAEIPSPTQSSSRRKRGRPLAVSSVPSKQSCAEEEATGLEPMTDVVAFQPLEETETEPAESTASEEAAEIPSPTQSSPRRKRGRPSAVSSVPSKQSCADDGATAAVTVSTVDKKLSSSLGAKPSGQKVLRKKQLKQPVPVDIEQTEKEADIPEVSCEAEEAPAKEPVKVAASPGKGKASVPRRQSGRAVRK